MEKTLSIQEVFEAYKQRYADESEGFRTSHALRDMRFELCGDADDSLNALMKRTIKTLHAQNDQLERSDLSSVEREQIRRNCETIGLLLEKASRL